MSTSVNTVGYVDRPLHQEPIEEAGEKTVPTRGVGGRGSHAWVPSPGRHVGDLATYANTYCRRYQTDVIRHPGVRTYSRQYHCGYTVGPRS